MRLFLWPLVLSILLLLAFVEVATPIVQRNGMGEHSLPVHKTLYISRGVYDDQVESLFRAAMEWYDVTNGQVVFDIKMLPRTNINVQDAIIVQNATPDNPEIMLLDSTNKNTTLALYTTNMGLAEIEFLDERIIKDMYVPVALHEMGHSLGLDHPDSPEHPYNGIGSLMFSSILFGNEHITTFDLQQFCRLYHCDWRKFHGVPEIQ